MRRYVNPSYFLRRRDLCLQNISSPTPHNLQLAPPDGFASLLTSWLTALSHSSRPVRRFCLASLVPASLPAAAASSGGRNQARQVGLMQLSRLIVRALHANRPPEIGTAGEDAATTTPTSSSIRHLVSKLITCLLTGLTRDADQEIRLLYAQWLGALGATDPSR